MADLYMLCGIPGSGKSTWVKKYLDKFDKHISRDEIRFSMVAEDEEYFSKETEVFKEYCSQITENLNKGYNVFADATHINKGSRKKLLDNISGFDNVFCIVIQNPLETTLKRNENRSGTRGYVPKSVIRRMHYQFEFPTHKEGFKIIYRIVSDDEPIQIIKSYEEN